MDNKVLKVIVVGYGSRGRIYTRYAVRHPDKMQVVAVVEPSEYRRMLAKEYFPDLPDERYFTDYQDCLKLGKIADVVVNTTMDELHIQVAIPFLKLGYDMLIEKPVTNNEEELMMLKKCADENHCRLVVCHVLRYTPFYRRIKEILLSGEIGELVEMQTDEMVGVAHASSSYIRGKWNNRQKCGSSMLLAKCCHDTDLLCWFNSGAKPTKVTSFGGRRFFIKEKAPVGAGTRCLVDCACESECPYSARKIYLRADSDSFNGLNGKRQEDVTMEEKIEALKTTHPFGKCIFKTDADIVDRQAVVVEFENGVLATHSMIAGVAKPCRNIHLIGTKGEIQGALEDNTFVVRRYNPYNCRYDERTENVEVPKGDGHFGGDLGLVEDFVNWMSGKPRSISSTVIEDSIYGHLIVYKADKSLDEGGITQYI